MNEWNGMQCKAMKWNERKGMNAWMNERTNKRMKEWNDMNWNYFEMNRNDFEMNRNMIWRMNWQMISNMNCEMNWTMNWHMKWQMISNMFWNMNWNALNWIETKWNEMHKWISRLTLGPADCQTSLHLGWKHVGYVSMSLACH
jgi:hypothetical protein